MRTPARALLALVAALVASPAARPAAAQGFRITGTSVAEWVKLRPLAQDSIPQSAAGDTVAGSVGDLRLGPNGQIVRCLSGEAYCYFRRATTPISGVPLTQDLEGNAWGLARGLRAYAHVRARGSTGSAGDFWPQANDPLDVLAAYLELDRGALRARAGRQWHTSGLGYYDFDGAALLWRARRGLSLEGFAGWSLVRGLDEPQTSEEIAALEPFVPDKRAYIFGAEGRWRPSGLFSASATYQRELRTDRAGLYSERASADARGRLFGATLDGQLIYDVAEEQANEARLRLQLPSFRRASLALEARHHEPFFELWTIWGAFSPVGFDEGRALLSWSAPAAAGLQLSLGGARRRYDDPDAGFPGFLLKRDGWRFTTDAAWQPQTSWSVQAGYSAEIGFGAARSDQSLSLRRLFGDVLSGGGGYAGLSLQAFQDAYEFRVAEGHVVGVGGETGFSLGGGTRIDGNLYYLRHLDRGPESPDWTQLRGSIRASWTIGREPGPRIPAPRTTPPGGDR
ncbi:MAG TPA: hypothetical protein VF832_04140 [Longimicrobiales bacterium]